MYPSFNTISGFGSNGAIIHYRSSHKSNKQIKGNNLYLLDSGSQYFYGTTDVTRTIAIGEISNFKKKIDFGISILRLAILREGSESNFKKVELISEKEKLIE